MTRSAPHAPQLRAYVRSIDDYRLIYGLDEIRRRAIALVVRHREAAYRDLDKIDQAVLVKNLAPFLNGIAASPS
jgi:hypothetical protein